ncbi:uncharacterized protein G2W53_027041 [Senna tora]|uniref:Uncharacterized protein n=1 Tax=Senna tora TaxID=362788 RepID=A0A834WJD5_9FABA|nr:uncharacterized protein G2W53_027041 [Senna tora]
MAYVSRDFNVILGYISVMEAVSETQKRKRREMGRSGCCSKEPLNRGALNRKLLEALGVLGRCV